MDFKWNVLSGGHFSLFVFFVWLAFLAGVFAGKKTVRRKRRLVSKRHF